jgi:uncharacterized sulfatase
MGRAIDGEIMDRRSFLKASGAALLASSCSSQQTRVAKRPNILFCISDDQTFAHVGAYGCKFVETPAFDRVAREGVLFENAFVSAPSCCPSRASALTGLPFYRLEETSMNHTLWAEGLTPYTDMLAAAGYHVGYTGKGWGPGNWKVAGRRSNPAGVEYNELKNDTPSPQFAPFDYAANFEAFLRDRPQGAPFCFWYGGIDPHRPFEPGSGVRNGKRLEDVEVPPFYPDTEAPRTDIADYALHIDWFDKHLDRMLEALETMGELDNTLIVVTSDNGMAFPRCKATLYDWGTHMPLAIRWGDKVKGGRIVEDFVSFVDFAPTFLAAAGLAVPPTMQGGSLMPILTSRKSGQIEAARDHVVMGIERHFPGGRMTGDPFPIRAYRTVDYLYIHNGTPQRWPVGDPDGPVWPDDDPTGGYGDVDGGLTKTFLVENRDRYPRHFELAFGKRPAEELYDVKADPYQMNNLADKPEYQAVKRMLRTALDAELKRTRDPRALGEGEFFDRVARRFDDTAKSPALSR